MRPLLPVLALLPLAAAATPNFPGVVQQELGLSSPPDCSLCHQGNQAVGTVVTPFGTAMRARGLVFYDEASLRTALSRLEAEQVDSDGDATPDVAELRAGGDPNRGAAPPPGEEGPSEPRYGCSSTQGAPAAAALLLLTLALLRRGGLRTRVSTAHTGVRTAVSTAACRRTEFRALALRQGSGARRHRPCS